MTQPGLERATRSAPRRGTPSAPGAEEQRATGSDGRYERAAGATADQVVRRLIGGDAGGPVVRRKRTGDAGPQAVQVPPPAPSPDDIVLKWVELSTVKGRIGNAPRSTALKQIDAAVAGWVGNGMKTPGAVDRNIEGLQAILDAVIDWQRTKTGASIRDQSVAALVNYVTPLSASFTARRTKRLQDAAVAAPLYDRFKAIDAETGRFAGKNVTDIKADRFEPANQVDGLMAHTKKNDDGTLTDEAMDELDAEQIEDARTLVETARACRLTVDPEVDTPTLRALMESEAQQNSLTKRSKVPELANETDPNGEPGGEVTEVVDGLSVTYDKSDVHAAERLAALQQAVRLITGRGVAVPRLDVYFPKYGRSITVGKDCQVTVGAKIADAVFHPPHFLAVSSANTGNAKNDREGGPHGELKFLSARLGADQALVHTIIHELGHALHYHHARGRFYNLNFAFFKGRADDGRSYQEIATSEVSGYGSNPREMVAEVFVGAVTGKKQFSDIVWSMYDAFGGHPLDL